ncbi:MAG: NADH-ubiquinone oxidoreductase-F iron-sulfur binding region domain-containing protein, partial [Bacillota bacterium]
RIGTYQMLRILERIVEGKGDKGDLERLEDLGRLISQISLCGLGKSAPRPVLSTLRFFRDEYKSHIYEKRCPTGSCSALKRLVIGPDCVQCGLCMEVCPQHAIIEKQEGFTIDLAVCVSCAACLTACPMECILEDTGEGRTDERNSTDYPDH